MFAADAKQPASVVALRAVDADRGMSADQALFVAARLSDAAGIKQAVAAGGRGDLHVLQGESLLTTGVMRDDVTLLAPAFGLPAVPDPTAVRGALQLALREGTPTPARHLIAHGAQVDGLSRTLSTSVLVNPSATLPMSQRNSPSTPTIGDDVHSAILIVRAVTPPGAAASSSTPSRPG